MTRKVSRADAVRSAESTHRWHLRPGLSVAVHQQEAVFFAGRMVLAVPDPDGVVDAVCTELGEGPRSVLDLVRSSGHAIQGVSEAVQRLRRAGILFSDDASAGDVPIESGFFALVGQGGADPGAAPGQVLRDSTVRLHGVGTIARPMVRELRSLGVLVRGGERRRHDRGHHAAVDLVVVGVPRADASATGAWLARTTQMVGRGELVLPVSQSASNLVVGPVLRRRTAPCPVCALDAHRHVATSIAVAPDAVVPASPELVAALVVGNVVRELTGVGSLADSQDVLLVDLESMSSSAHIVLAGEHCSSCGPGVLGEAGSTVLAYEDAIARRPSGSTRHSVRRRLPAHGRRDRDSGGTDQQDFFTSRALALVTREGTGDQRTRFEGRVVASLRRAFVEPREPDGRSTAPSGNTTGGAHAYVIAGGGGVFGVEPGVVLRYDEVGNRLLQVRRSPWRGASRRSGADADAPSVQLVVTTSGKSLDPQSSELAPRIGCLDAGIVLFRLRAAAEEIGLRMTVRYQPSRQSVPEILAGSDETVVATVDVLRGIE